MRGKHRAGAPRGARSIPLWRDSLFWLALLLTSFAAAPFLLPGYFWGANDARHHVYFLFEYDRLVQDGIWWPRWSPDFAFGYGYPFFNIYGPLSHFLAEILLHFFGFSHTAAVESIFVLSIVASAAAMYVFVRSWAGRGAGLVAALVYTYAPYHLLNLYVRANLAESMAFVWLPLCLWTARGAVLAAWQRDFQDVGMPPGGRGASRRWESLEKVWPWVAGLAVSYAGLMVTSNLVVVLFTPLLAAYVLLLTVVYALPPGSAGRTVGWGRRIGFWLRRCLWPALGGVLGLGLSAAFWLPMLLERNYVRVDQWFGGRYDFRGHFVYLYQLFSPNWGFGVSVPGPLDPISFQIGAVALIFAVLGVLMVPWHNLRQRAQLAAPPVGATPGRAAGGAEDMFIRFRWEVAFFAAAGVLATIPALQFAAGLWELPVIGALFQSAQFPWRWLVLPTLCVSVLGGLVARNLPGEAHLGAVAGEVGKPSPHPPGLSLPLLALAVVVILGSYSYLQVQISEPAEGPVSLAGLMRFQQSSDEMTGSTRWVKEIPRWSPMADYYMSQANQGLAVKPVDSKLDYSVFDYETFAAESVAHNTVSEEVFYANRTTGLKTLVFNHFYYPGWHAYLLDGKHGARVQQLSIVPETTGTLGRMTVNVPPGEGYLLLVYEDTPPRTIGGAITLATLGVLLLGSLWAWWQVKRTRPAAGG